MRQAGVPFPVEHLTMHFLAFFRGLQEVDEKEAQVGADNSSGCHTTLLQHLLPGKRVKRVTKGPWNERRWALQARHNTQVAAQQAPGQVEVIYFSSFWRVSHFTDWTPRFWASGTQCN